MKTAEEILPQGQTRFSPKEAAAYIGHDASTVSRWCESGKIEAVKPMGRWQITRSAVAKLLVAFGVASHLAATGLSHNHKSIPNTRKIFHTIQEQKAIEDNWSFFHS